MRAMAVVPLILLVTASAARAEPITIVGERRWALANAHVADSNGDAEKRAQAEFRDAMYVSRNVTTGTSSGLVTTSLMSSYADPFHIYGIGAAAISSIPAN